jgi:hypothetical protein
MSTTAERPTNHIARLYVIVAMLAVFFVLWTNIAIHPWQASQSAAPSGPAAVSTQPAPANGSQASVTTSQPVTATRSS